MFDDVVAWAKYCRQWGDWDKLKAGLLAEVECLRGARDRPVIDANHIDRQRAFSEATFGPGRRTDMVVDHLRKELAEVLAAPEDLEEWVDVILLGFDGAWRTGADSQAVINAIKAKQELNEQRDWPEWRTTRPDGAIEHIRETRSGAVEDEPGVGR